MPDDDIPIRQWVTGEIGKLGERMDALGKEVERRADRTDEVIQRLSDNLLRYQQGQQEGAISVNDNIDRRVAKSVAPMIEEWKRHDGRIQDIHDRQLSSGRFTIQMAAFALSLVVAIVGMGAWFTNSTTAAALATPKAEITRQAESISILQAETRAHEERDKQVAAENARSIQDRVDMSGRIGRMDSEFSSERSDRKAEEKTIESKLAEVETQFRGEDQMRNIQWANNQRMIALLWEKLYGSRFPSDIAYYPNIAAPPSSSK